MSVIWTIECFSYFQFSLFSLLFFGCRPSAISTTTYFHRCFIVWEPINANSNFYGSTVENNGKNKTSYLLVFRLKQFNYFNTFFIQKNAENIRSFHLCLIRVSGIEVVFFCGESDMSCQLLFYIAQCSLSRARRGEVTSPGLRASSSIEISGTPTFRNALENAQLEPKTEVTRERSNNFSKFVRPIR
jgi:hypothetical protein